MTGAKKVFDWIKEHHIKRHTPSYEEILMQLDLAIKEEESTEIIKSVFTIHAVGMSSIYETVLTENIAKQRIKALRKSYDGIHFFYKELPISRHSS